MWFRKENRLQTKMACTSFFQSWPFENPKGADFSPLKRSRIKHPMGHLLRSWYNCLVWLCLICFKRLPRTFLFIFPSHHFFTHSICSLRFAGGVSTFLAGGVCQVSWLQYPGNPGIRVAWKKTRNMMKWNYWSCSYLKTSQNPWNPIQFRIFLYNFQYSFLGYILDTVLVFEKHYHELFRKLRMSVHLVTRAKVMFCERHLNRYPQITFLSSLLVPRTFGFTTRKPIVLSNITSVRCVLFFFLLLIAFMVVVVVGLRPRPLWTRWAPTIRKMES